MPETNLSPDTPVFEAGLASDVAQTHVLLIGVGDYPFAQSGSAAAQKVGILDPLTSPCRSVMAVYDFLLATKGNWVPPIGSIYLLLSPPANDPLSGDMGKLASTAEFANIEAAFYAWKARCEASKDNLSFFYFCGHGFEDANQFLPAADFGKNENRVWENSLDFDGTRKRFHQVKAETQCFFVDACRTKTGAMNRIQADGQALGDDLNMLHPGCENDVTIKASAANRSSYGPNLKPSYFSQALLRVLRGMGATEPEDDWIIESSNISAQIKQSIDLVTPKGSEQNPDRKASGNRVVLKLPDGPTVPVRIVCEPEDALSHAELDCKINKTGPSKQKRKPHPSPWDLEIPSGKYIFAARFPKHNFQDAEKEYLVHPPSKLGKLRVQKP